MTRCFLVGSPRSGTTLLQSMLAAHSRVYSLPETHFFKKFPLRAKHPLYILRPSAAKIILKALMNLGCREDLIPRFPRHLLAPTSIKAFVAHLDEEANKQQCCAWLEKTPNHLHRIEIIARYVSGARFIHIVRDGKATIASLYEATQEHPDGWGGARTLDQCIDRWVLDVQKSLSFLGNPDHCFVRYESLIDNPESILAKTCDFLKIDFENAMLTNFSLAYEEVAVKGASWTKGVTGSLGQRQLKKFESYLSDAQRTRIVDRIQSYDISPLENFKL